LRLSAAGKIGPARGIRLIAPLLNVLVTGASRGLGLAMTQMLAASGYRVIAVARKTSDELEAAAAAARDARRARSSFEHAICPTWLKSSP